MTMSKDNYDFGGYATRNGIKCKDGRVILRDAFKHNDGKRVPLVWMHDHDNPENVLGHGILENRPDGVYVYGKFNDTPAGKQGRSLVKNKDVESLSIYANALQQIGSNVAHGEIIEVSLVLSGSNRGAFIDTLNIQHADGSVTELEDEAIIFSGLTLDYSLSHADKSEDDETIEDVFNTLSDKQKTVVYALIANALEGGDEEARQSDEEGENFEMKHNVFDGTNNESKYPVLTREDFATIVTKAKANGGSFKQAFLAHAGTYGIDNISYLFPDAKAVTDPTFIKRDTGWVGRVLKGTRHTPFSRIKSVHADITPETARALGYITGNLKKDEVFSLLRRTTDPTTIYKKQKLDRDDIIDITDMNVVSWLKLEMRGQLDEELARAILISDGRDGASLDKINEERIRPIWTDSDLYAHHVMMAEGSTTVQIMEEILRQRVNYKGSGNPTMFTSNGFLMDMMLLKDTTGRRLYNTKAELAATLMVEDIVEVPQFTGATRNVTVPAAHTLDLYAIIVNLYDYTIGADKGGEINFFDDFDIDYNQEKYLIETRVSGALYVPKSALVIEVIDDVP